MHSVVEECLKEKLKVQNSKLEEMNVYFNESIGKEREFAGLKSKVNDLIKSDS
jgi:hypothetical protein